MRKRLLSLILVVVCLLSAFAFVGCTDKKEEPRKLTTIEKRLVGSWDFGAGLTVYTFKNDGTYIVSGSEQGKGTFKEKERPVDEYGTYYIIEMSSDNGNVYYLYYYYAEYPDTLYHREHDISGSAIAGTRVV